MKPSQNYASLFYEAHTFLKASELIEEHSRPVTFTHDEMDRNVGLIYAANVNHAYSFELFIKCIMVIENGEYCEGHHLILLFQKLNPETQKSIIDYFDKNHSGIRRNRTYWGIFEKIDFVELVTEAEEAFVQLRYHFDRKQNSPHYDLDGAIKSLIYHISTIKPELKPL